MNYLGSPGKDHPYARPSDEDLAQRQRTRDAPMRRGRFMVIAAFAYLLIFQVGNWLVLAMRAIQTGSPRDSVVLLVQVVVFAALAYETYVGYTVARYVTSLLFGLAALFLFVMLFKTNDQGELDTPIAVLVFGSIEMAGFAAIAVGFVVLKDIHRFMEHQRTKRTERAN